MANTVSYNSQVTTSEVIASAVSGQNLPSISHTELNTQTSFSASALAIFLKAMSAGSATIDLTAITDQLGRTVNLTGLKILALKLIAPATNSAGVTIAKGATNGFTGLGSAFSLLLNPGDEVTLLKSASGIAVSSSLKTLDMSGSGTDGLLVHIDAG